MAAKRAARKASAARATPKGPTRLGRASPPVKQARTRYPRGKGPGKEATQFKPGQSGNPNGRPKEPTLEERIRARLASPSPKRDAEDPERIRLDDLAEGILTAIDDGDSKITIALMDRVWIKTQKVEMTHSLADHMRRIRGEEG